MSEKKRILIVDDEPDFSAIVKHNLEKEGFEVELAYDGVEGLEKIKDHAPDLVLLDVMMAGIDGYEVCRELKENPKHADIPVIMLTAVADHVASTRYTHHDGKSMEAEDYLPKPASVDRINRSIKRLL